MLLEDRRGEMDVGRDGPVAVHILWCGGGAPCVAIEGGHHRHIVIAPAPLHGHAQPLLRLKVVGVVGADLKDACILEVFVSLMAYSGLLSSW